MSLIHPTAVIHPKAQLAADVEVGPYAVIDGHVSLGPACKVGPHVYLTGHTTAGANNRFYAGCVVGEAPQDVKYKDQPTQLRLGDNNLIREGATIHRAATPEGATVVGSNNFIMCNAHIGHNAVVGNHVILVNGCLLAGHVQVGDRAMISGNCLVHQFVRVGTLAMFQGGAAASQDVPPFAMVHEVNILCGLNVIGLRRAGLSPAERQELKALYRRLFRGTEGLTVAIEGARAQFTSPAARQLLDFCATSKRGICREAGGVGKATAENDDAEH